MINFLKQLLGKTNTEKQNIIPFDDMKYLIVGLGNIGVKYDNTRHNIGFEVLDKLAEAKEAIFETERLGDVAKIKHKGRTFILLKPSTFMNLSGKAVRYWMDKEKVNWENLLVIVDDLNLPFGKLRMRGKGSDGGHNGLKDINEKMGKNNYARLRFGIGSEFGKGHQVDYVLGEWDGEENEQLPALIERSCDMIISFGTAGLARTMSDFNNK
jgi:PTH1 family peptidyl-tRNA hydrolase